MQKTTKCITRNRPTHRSTFSKQYSITSRSPKHVNTNQDQQHCCSRCIDIPPGCYMQVSVKKCDSDIDLDSTCTFLIKKSTHHTSLCLTEVSDPNDFTFSLIQTYFMINKNH